MNLYVLPNLAAHAVKPVEIIDPPAVTRPAFRDKAEYRRWCSDSATEHVFVSVVEGVNPHVRVSAGNAPWRLHAIVGEFDATVPSDWESEHLRKADTPPTWSTRTFSGHGRVYWELAIPVDISNPRFADEFFKVAYAELKARRCGPGFEQAESAKVTQYFEAGTDWTKIGGPIPEATIEAWKFKAAQRVNWAKEAVAIPIERVRAEAEKRWPGRWPGGYKLFEVGARGVRFWDDTADAASVLVTESGCVCFTGDKTFMSWSEIFGPDWVKRQSEDIVGNALLNLWCEPATGRYWRKETTGRKVQIPTRSDLILHLTVAGLSPRAPRGETLSEIDRAIYALQQTRCVDGIHPAFYCPEDVVTVGQKRLLNTSQVRPGVPAPEKGEWGKGFPWLAKFFEASLREVQLPYFLAWFAHGYQAALLGQPARGLAMFIAGNSGMGKTLTSTEIAGYVFGAREDASSFLTGEDSFNAGLLGVPLWTVDDAVASSDRKRHMRYSQIVKYVTANDSIKARGMYREGYTVYWRGRLIVTLNMDAESARMLPCFDITSVDKMLVFRFYDHDLVFPSIEEIRAELPYFCAFLRDWTIPEELRSPRFGVKPYHHPDLVLAAAEASETMGAEELLLIWRKRYFEDNKDKTEWVGTASELITEFSRYEDLRELATRQIPTVNSMGRYVSTLEARGEEWIMRVPSRRSRYRAIRVLAPDPDES